MTAMPRHSISDRRRFTKTYIANDGYDLELAALCRARRRYRIVGIEFGEQPGCCAVRCEEFHEGLGSDVLAALPAPLASICARYSGAMRS
jgi:hypothetical protein